MAQPGEKTGDNRGREGGGKLRLIVRQVIYEGTGTPGLCQWKDRSSVTIASSALCIHCAWAGLRGGCGDESGWRAAEAIVRLSAAVPLQGRGLYIFTTDRSADQRLHCSLSLKLTSL